MPSQNGAPSTKLGCHGVAIKILRTPSAPRVTFGEVPLRPLDRIVFRTDTVQVGAFTCPSRDPRFRDSGPTERQLVVFPRTSVWIRHAGSRAFVADPQVVTIYNRGQEYTRARLAPEGDRCDWFGISPATARDIVSAYDVRAADETSPFRYQRGPCSRQLYLRQRALFHQLERGQIDGLAAEESALAIIDAVIAAAFHADGRRPIPLGSADAHRDLVERARADIAAHVCEPTTVTDIARRLGVSAFHLCRVFRRLAGTSLHAYRIDLRRRMSLEPLAADRVNVSRLAADLGFASHSHFTATVRQGFGLTPTDLRGLLRGP